MEIVLIKQNVSDEIKGNAYKKVITDLRYNSGWDSGIFEPMISELSKLQEDHYFKVYTIIGGNVDCYGELKSFTLKNIPVTVWY